MGIIVACRGRWKCPATATATATTFRGYGYARQVDDGLSAPTLTRGIGKDTFAWRARRRK